MTDSIIKAVNTGLTCGTPVATAAFVATPGFIADDLAFGGIATVTCGVASLFGLDVRDAVVKGWYGIETVSKETAEVLTNTATDELAQKAADELAKKAADELAKKAADELAKKAADELAKKAAEEVIKQKLAEEALKRALEEAAKKSANITITDTCEAVLKCQVPVVDHFSNLAKPVDTCAAFSPIPKAEYFQEATKKVVNEVCKLTDAPKVLEATGSQTAQNTLVRGFSAARTVCDVVNAKYTNYVGSYLPTWADQSFRSLACSPVFLLKAGYNMGSALYNGKSVTLALVDTSVSAGITLATKAGVEMLSNATGVSSAYLEIPAQVVTQVLYSKTKSAVVHGYDNFVKARKAAVEKAAAEKVAAEKVAAEKVAAEKVAAEKAAVEKQAVDDVLEQQVVDNNPVVEPIQIPVQQPVTFRPRSNSQERLLEAAQNLKNAVNGVVAAVKLQEPVTTNGRTFNGVSY